MKFSWKNFPEMLLTHDPKSEILKKAWKNVALDLLHKFAKV